MGTLGNLAKLHLGEREGRTAVIKLLGYMAAGVIAGLLFFGVLILMIFGGLQEPFVWLLIACGAGVVFATAYLRRARQIRREGKSGEVRNGSEAVLAGQGGRRSASRPGANVGLWREAAV